MGISSSVRNDLLKQAQGAQELAYAPYSNYLVGAALLGKSGRVYTGCNVENAVYSETICAERTAVVKAVSEGEQEFVAVAVATRDGGSPCGACRQVLSEFSPDLLVLMVDAAGNVQESTIRDLLPDHFGPQNLK